MKCAIIVRLKHLSDTNYRAYNNYIFFSLTSHSTASTFLILKQNVGYNFTYKTTKWTLRSVCFYFCYFVCVLVCIYSAVPVFAWLYVNLQACFLFCWFVGLFPNLSASPFFNFIHLTSIYFLITICLSTGQFRRPCSPWLLAFLLHQLIREVQMLPTVSTTATTMMKEEFAVYSLVLGRTEKTKRN